MQQVPVPAIKTWAKCVYMGQNFAVNNMGAGKYRNGTDGIILNVTLA